MCLLGLARVWARVWIHSRLVRSLIAETLISGHSLAVPSSLALATLITAHEVAIIVASSSSSEVRCHARRRVHVTTWASYGAWLMKIITVSSSLTVVAATKLLARVVIIVVTTTAYGAWTANSARPPSTLILALVCVVIIVVRVGIEDIPREGITLTPTATIHFSERGKLESKIKELSKLKRSYGNKILIFYFVSYVGASQLLNYHQKIDLQYSACDFDLYTYI